MGNSVVIERGVSISFSKTQNEIVKTSNENRCLSFSYSKKNIEENFEFSILLIYNFIHLFLFTVSQMRITHVHKSSELGIIEKAIGIKGKKEYIEGTAFNYKQMLVMLQIRGYNIILQENNSSLEDLCKWFFKCYIVQEFNVNGFNINIPSKYTNYLEKCRILVPEIDSLLKQYKLWVEDGYINNELLEIISDHMFFKDVPSLIIEKYIYPSIGEYDTDSFLLCSDQSIIKHIDKINKFYTNFIDLLSREEIQMSDFHESQKMHLNWLLRYNYIYVNESKHLKCNIDIVMIIKELFDNNFLSFYHIKNKNQVIYGLLEHEIINFGSLLFSIPEQEYFNYLLNSSEFLNGLDLRNH